ncbi:lysosomal acid phosphatase-like isoform X3 [Uloborus diversus]|uniref:lysosomal acid phosphatase-like isoform X3 n=1 Tax=Uloborus diversus TaxID=327109 RepID=UPI002409964C|nr:lysosomal acid phosphatase-like isoform X3 [Uloborus diversus]
MVINKWAVIICVIAFSASDFVVLAAEEKPVAADTLQQKTERSEESGSEEGRELVQLQILFRHGMRAPDQTFPGDLNPIDVWREGVGRLTQHGKYQMYCLGRHLRWLYRNFITASPVEVEVLSSKRNRCLLSALCLASAMYEPTEEWEFLPNFRWQPIPVQFIAHGKDPYLGKVFDCPAAQREVEKMHESPEGKKFLNENKKTYNFLIPDWAEKHWEELRYVNDMSYYLSGRTKKYQTLRAGPLLGMIRDKFESTVNGTLLKKVSLYSGHSKNMVAVLSALDVFNMKEPPFAATVIFELYREPGGHSHSVRLLFLNSTTPEAEDQTPNVLNIPKCGEFCPFESFSTIVKSFTPENWEKQCR